MGRLPAKLFVLVVLVAAGVYFWYGRLEKTLLTDEGTPGQATVASKTAEPVVARTSHAEEKNSQPQSVDFQVIVQRNIFQAVLDPVKAPPKKEAKKAVPTSLDLTLLGTVAGDEKTARAIIVDNKAKKQDIFQIGDAVQGAFIETIDRGKITLEVDGRNEVLLIKERKGGGPGAPELPANQAFSGSAVERPKPIARRRVPRLRHNRRISRRPDPESVESDPDIPELDVPDEIDEPGPVEIQPDALVPAPTT